MLLTAVMGQAIKSGVKNRGEKKNQTVIGFESQTVHLSHWEVNVSLQEYDQL